MKRERVLFIIFYFYHTLLNRALWFSCIPEKKTSSSNGLIQNSLQQLTKIIVHSNGRVESNHGLFLLFCFLFSEKCIHVWMQHLDDHFWGVEPHLHATASQYNISCSWAAWDGIGHAWSVSYCNNLTNTHSLYQQKTILAWKYATTRWVFLRLFTILKPFSTQTRCQTWWELHTAFCIEEEDGFMKT